MWDISLGRSQRRLDAELLLAAGTALRAVDLADAALIRLTRNTDIADEFTKLIVTQQAYSANTRVITTSDEMLQDIINIKR